ncbi:hypothetical protein [Rhodobaculum claviforme]|uniref:Gamma-glutamyl kinase n=1 Tax=Rhodobaculum claviforme TaxID=1549854 RepID=A0A934WHV6_9RHOB|nr:hypothetical protein [Rhodobaculum claviforme]MBK5927540.1 hypothetical protein [Rhodobaculum claviforme]
MLVFWDQRLVFLATPKTGSTAIEAALDGLSSFSILRPPAAKHTDAARYRRFVGPFLRASAGAEFTTVALMREPQDWLASWYRFRQGEEGPDADGAAQGLGFDRFVRDHMADPVPPHADVGSQAAFLKGPDGGVDRVFAYEDIDRFVAFLEDRLDCGITLPRLNVSPDAALEIEPDTVARLRRHAAADYAMWERLRG